MIKSTFLLTFGFLVVLTGCASRSDIMLQGRPPVAPVAADNPLQHKLAIGEVTGAGNVVMHPEAVSNDTFKAVLQHRLAESGLAATGSPNYIINAELDYDASIDFPWNDRSAEEDVIYTVREVGSQKQVYSVTIKTTAVVTAPSLAEFLLVGASANTSKLMAAYNNAVLDNIRQFLQKLAQWQPDGAATAK